MYTIICYETHQLNGKILERLESTVETETEAVTIASDYSAREALYRFYDATVTNEAGAIVMRASGGMVTHYPEGSN